MKKWGWVLREILFRLYERGEWFMSQKALAQACELSLGIVNPIVAKLERFGAVERKPLGFRVTDPRKTLLYWASTRNLAKDVVYSIGLPLTAPKIEAQMPAGAILTGCSGYRLRFGEAPIDYDEVYVYADPREVRRRFPERATPRKNVFVLRSDPHLERRSEGGVAPLAQLYVDLWQLGGPADKFVEELDRRLESTQVGAFEAMVQRIRKSFESLKR